MNFQHISCPHHGEPPTTERRECGGGRLWHPATASANHSRPRHSSSRISGQNRCPEVQRKGVSGSTCTFRASILSLILGSCPKAQSIVVFRRTFVHQFTSDAFQLGFAAHLCLVSESGASPKSRLAWGDAKRTVGLVRFGAAEWNVDGALDDQNCNRIRWDDTVEHRVAESGAGIGACVEWRPGRVLHQSGLRAISQGRNQIQELGEAAFSR